MSDAATTTASIAQIISAGGVVAFAYLVARLLDRFLEAQVKRDEAHAEERRELQETASKERAAMLRFMGVLEERSRVADDDRRRGRARTSPFGVPLEPVLGRRRSHPDTEIETEDT